MWHLVLLNCYICNDLLLKVWACAMHLSRWHLTPLSICKIRGSFLLGDLLLLRCSVICLFYSPKLPTSLPLRWLVMNSWRLLHCNVMECRHSRCHLTRRFGLKQLHQTILGLYKGLAIRRVHGKILLLDSRRIVILVDLIHLLKMLFKEKDSLRYLFTLN